MKREVTDFFLVSCFVIERLKLYFSAIYRE